MATGLDPEVRRALLEEARDRLRVVRRSDRTEALLAVHSLSASAGAAGLTDLLALLAGLERSLAAGEDGAIDRAIAELLSALERTQRGEDAAEAEELLECFVAEAAEHVAAMMVQLDRLEDDMTDGEATAELYRALHTFKGAAAIVGQDDASSAAHLLEDLLERVREGSRPLDRPLLELIRAGASLLRAMADDPDRAEDHRRALAALAGAHGAVASAPREPRRGSRPSSAPIRRVERRKDAPLTLRVPVEETTELLLAQREARAAAMGFKETVVALRAVVADLHEARALLLCSATGPAASQVLRSLPADLGSAASAVEFAAQNLERHTERVSRAEARSRAVLDRLRATPASWLFDRLVAVAEEAAKRLDRSVAVDRTGEGVAVDRAVAGRILEPLIHLVRNAVAHGCEGQAQRVAHGKEPTGRILLEAVAGPEAVTYAVQDDGPGIDLDRLKERLLGGRIRSGAEVEAATPDQLLEWIFLPGVSTQVSADEVSGRGMGLDAVRAALSRLGGKVSVATARGRGTRFEVRVPRGIGRMRVLLLRQGQLRLGVPLAAVTRVEAVPRESSAGGRLLTAEGDLPIVSVAGRLGLRRRADLRHTAVVVESPDGPVALEVEAVDGAREVLADRLSGLLAKFGPYGGVAQDDEGELLLLLDLSRLAVRTPAARVTPTAPKVLVADDSRTVRGMVRKALTAAGYEVELASDGLEAWQRLLSERFDLLLTDLEMPRLSGLELVERLAGDPRLARLPVIVLTSRASERARRSAAELGVRAFVVKPAGAQRIVREVEGALDPKKGSFGAT